MGYQVLARKWRPGRFADLVGQEHVVTAIANALDNDRLHHAYLFTGTRGVGKTTIARIFAKSLNCEQGQSANPCGQCPTCLEIEQGNYVDLLEIDAASRTKVEDTRELLDNVQYKPTRGKFKVYLIDEVHMLSKHSFNALLKTLEEPPPHVKFLLATTDPQKLPITILSRCLQFNLKALSREQISNQLTHVLEQESVPFEAPAVSLLARAAQGSMRDALSLTDQAIAQGDNAVSAPVVTDMLGLMDRHQLLKLLQAVVSKAPADVMSIVDRMAEQAPDYGQVIAELSSLLHQIALTHWVPEACKLETTSAKAIFQLSKQISAEQVQVLYQICIQGKKDLPYAIDGRSALEMTLLRMMSFVPVEPVADGDKIISSIAPASTANAATQTQPHDDLPVSAEETNEISSESVHHDADIPVEKTPVHSTRVSDEVEEQHLHQEMAAIEQEASEFRQYDTPPPSEPYPPLENEPPYPEEVYTQPPSMSQTYDNSHAEPSPSSDQTLTTTQEMLALRERLKKSKEEAKEDAAKKQQTPQAGDQAWTPPKAPEKATSPEPTQLAEQSPVEAGPVSEDVPPWVEESIPNQQQESTTALQPVNETQSSQWGGQQTTTTSFEQSESAGEAYDGNLSPYLDSGDKLVAAQQIDDWSALVEKMPVAGLLKQIALNASFSKQASEIHLLLDNKQAHLLNPTTEAQLKQALQSVVGDQLSITITLGEPETTPSKIQGEIKQMRQQYAHQVVQTDNVFQDLITNFDANVVPDSVLPR